MKLRFGAHLIFTGGEPTLHQKKICEYLHYFIRTFGFTPIIEIETNGSILISEELHSFLTYINCSPKLKNSGESFKKRFNVLALTDINSRKGSSFKFVINQEDDIIEILQEFAPFIDMKKVILMPAGDSKESLDKVRKEVAELAIQLNVKYSDRLQVVIWDKTTGV